jgi:hypothetical protein
LSYLLNQAKGKHARQMPKQLGEARGQIWWSLISIP